MLGIMRRNRKRNTWVRSITKVFDIMERVEIEMAMGGSHNYKNGQKKCSNGTRECKRVQGKTAEGMDG